MRMRAPLLGAVALVLLTNPTQAQVKDVTELLPAQTLAYVELRHPDRLSKELTSLLRGSYLDDMPARMARFRELRGDNRNFFFDDYMIGMFSMFVSPEMIAEAARLQGGAVALLGFDKERTPEVVGILLTGESNGPTFFMRVYLTVGPDVRKVAEVEGVNLYRERRQDFRVPPPPPGQPAPPAVFHDTGPTFALLPGALVIGSTTDSVKQVVRRIKGRTAEPALSSVAAIKEGARLRDRPGLFGYADMDALNSQLDEILKDSLPPGAPNWNILKAYLNPKAARNAVASLMLENGTADLRLQLTLDPKQNSPILDLLSDKKANTELLHFVPKEALAAATMSLPDGEKRWEKVLAMMDAMAKAQGESDQSLPSKMIAAVEEKLKARIGKDVMNRINGFAFAVDPRDEIPQGGTHLGMLVLSAGSAEDAQYLEDLLPRLIGVFGRDEPAAPTRETIQGVKISSLPNAGLPWGTAVHYGRQGTTLVIGQDRKTVAAALAGGVKKEGWLNEPRAAASVKEFKDPVAVGLLSVSQSLVELLKVSQPRGRVMVKPALPPGAVEKPAIKPPAGPDPVEKYTKELLKVTEPLPPVVIALERQPTSATLTVRQVGMKGITARVFDIWIDATLEQFLQNRGAGGFGPGIGVKDAPPVPVPEKQ